MALSADKQAEIVTEALERFATAEQAESLLREKAVEDLKFCYVSGEQWEGTVKQERENRPCYEYNKIRPIVRQIVNEQRQNRPGLKFRGVDDRADPETAEVLTGMSRNIYNQSDGDTVIDLAFEHAVVGGFGVFGITTDFSDDTGFEQEIRLRSFRNPFTVHFDPAARDFLKRDGRYAFVTESLPKEEFQEKFPDASLAEWDQPIGEHMEDWFEDDAVRVAEYWRRLPVKKTIALLSDGSLRELDEKIEDELEGQIVQKRRVDSFKVEMFILTANEVLEGPFEWAGRFIPLIPVYGESIDIEGEMHYAGIVRFSKDGQRSYNYHRTTMVETMALQPKAPYIGTKKMFRGVESIWKNANKKNYAMLVYEPDERVPGGKPQREQPPAISQGMMAEVELANRDILDTTGVSLATLGQDEGEQSGSAILARQRKGELATFAFQDNLAKSLRYAGEQLVDLIPKIYDTQRVVRILGEDGTESFEQINQHVFDRQSGEFVPFHDLRIGKYDVDVTVGPSYTTKRQETTNAMLELMRLRPETAELALDIFFKNLDIPESDELRKRVRKLMIQRGLVEPNPDDEDEARLIPSPEQQQAQAQQQQLMQQMQMAGIQAEIEKKVQEAVGEEIKNRKLAGEAEEAGLLAEDKITSIIGKTLDNMIKENQFEVQIDPRTGRGQLVAVGEADLNPQVFIGSGG